MTERDVPVVLTDDLLIGRGGHKTVYLAPDDPSRCIKIIRDPEDLDWKRELRYRKSRMKRGLPSTVLTEYYGPVETNLGPGHLFERVVDFDGTPSRSVEDIVIAAAAAAGRDAERAREDLAALLSDFYRSMTRESVITSNMEAMNFLVQRISPDARRVRVIDNIGSPVTLPLIFYIDCLARSHVRRYWHRFITDLGAQYPTVIDKEMKKRLLG